MIFEKYLRETRERRNYSLRQCAKLCSISAGYLSYVERGYIRPSKNFLCSFAKTFDMDINTALISSDLLPDYIQEFYFQRPKAVGEFLGTCNSFDQDEWDRLFNIVKVEN